MLPRIFSQLPAMLVQELLEQNSFFIFSSPVFLLDLLCSLHAIGIHRICNILWRVVSQVSYLLHE